MMYSKHFLPIKRQLKHSTHQRTHTLLPMHFTQLSKINLWILFIQFRAGTYVKEYCHWSVQPAVYANHFARVLSPLFTETIAWLAYTHASQRQNNSFVQTFAARSSTYAS